MGPINSAQFDAVVRSWPTVTDQDGVLVGYMPSCEQVRRLRSMTTDPPKRMHTWRKWGGWNHRKPQGIIDPCGDCGKPKSEHPDQVSA